MTSGRKQIAVHRSFTGVAALAATLTRKTNFAEGERIIIVDLQKLIGLAARIKDKNIKGVKDG